MEVDIKYMRRALALAALGRGFVSPNPMVGAVIVAPDGRIIGDGYHRRWGGPHAEVNAVASVRDADKSLIGESVMYVTLEPCSHYGKTPPCAKMLIDCGFKHVVVGAGDPFVKVAGRGIAMLRQAGVEVVEGVLAEESRRLNVTFFTAHTLGRPFVMLKWAQDAHGHMDVRRRPNEPAARFSTPVTNVAMHKLRSQFDAIMVGGATAVADNPRLDNRLWWGHSPRPVVIARVGDLPEDLHVWSRQPIVYEQDVPLTDVLGDLYSRGVTSLMVEGGSRILSRFIEAGLWDVARVEVTPWSLGARGAIPAPVIDMLPCKTSQIGANTIMRYSRGVPCEVKKL